MARLSLRGARSLVAASCLVTVIIFLATPASAGPILIDTWYEFGFTDPAVPATGCFPDDPAGIFCVPSSGTPTVFLDPPPWTFVAVSGVLLTVVDAFESGDAFEMFDFGAPIGLTSVPGARPVDCGDDPVPCLAVPAMSRGFFPLIAGAHSLTVVPTASPGGLGSAYLMVGSKVPEPAIILLLGPGLAMWRLRRARKLRER